MDVQYAKKHVGLKFAELDLYIQMFYESSEIDPEIYSGFAFGFGLTRLAMVTYGINDIRLLHSGKLDFLKQF